MKPSHTFPEAHVNDFRIWLFLCHLQLISFQKGIKLLKQEQEIIEILADRRQQILLPVRKPFLHHNSSFLTVLFHIVC